MSRQGFCWECSKKLWGNSFKTLKVDGHIRILHKACAKQIKRELDHKKIGDEYHSMMWVAEDANRPTSRTSETGAVDQESG